MSEEDQRLFYYPYQVEGSHVQEGNVLGLAIVKFTVERLAEPSQ